MTSRCRSGSLPEYRDPDPERQEPARQSGRARRNLRAGQFAGAGLLEQSGDDREGLRAESAEPALPGTDLSNRRSRLSERRGEIMFLGRKDFQIKHLGYRIELGEIEHAVAAWVGIRAWFTTRAQGDHALLRGDQEIQLPRSVRAGRGAAEVHASDRFHPMEPCRAIRTAKSTARGCRRCWRSSREPALDHRRSLRAGGSGEATGAARDELLSRARQAAALSIDRRELFSVTAGDVLFVMRRDRRLLSPGLRSKQRRGSECSSARAVRELSRDRDRRSDRQARAGRRDRRAVHADRGHDHCVLNGMTKLAEPSSPSPAPDPEVVYANGDDGVALARMSRASSTVLPSRSPTPTR